MAPASPGTWSAHGVAPPPPPESHTPYLVSVGLIDAQTTTLPPSPPALQPTAAEEREEPEVQPQPQHASERSAAQSLLAGPTALASGQQQVDAVRSISSTSPGSSAQELIHSHELARAAAAHRADVQALQAHQAARETQLQAWCAAQLESQLAELERGREALLTAAAEAQAKGAAEAAQRQARAEHEYSAQLASLRSEQREETEGLRRLLETESQRLAEARCRGDVGEMWARYGRDVGETAESP